ncbi:MAG: SMP-30/gluconolactonase/LRE family protein, partial [Calditrichia bacterium]
APLLINDLAFDNEGYLYVTDSFQATIWRVPPDGGAPEIWFHDPGIDGFFGPNGIRFDKKGEYLYFSVTAVNTGQGIVYRLPPIDNPALSDLEVFHTYSPEWPEFLAPGPDGIAFGKSGRLYVALAGTSQISVLDPEGVEIARYLGPAQTSDPASPLPWVNPANIAFNSREKTLLVTNHANRTGLPDPGDLFAVFDVFVKDKAGGLPETHEDEDEDHIDDEE